MCKTCAASLGEGKSTEAKASAVKTSDAKRSADETTDDASDAASIKAPDASSATVARPVKKAKKQEVPSGALPRPALVRKPPPSSGNIITHLLSPTPTPYTQNESHF